MDNNDLMQRIIECSEDKKGITERFLGNSNLYRMCFTGFLEESNFRLLCDGIENKKYRAAFEAAHALKGISGNLGLTDFYKSICVLIESLRAKCYVNIEVEYKEVQNQLNKLNILYNE